jgi:hypothetical protein
MAMGRLDRILAATVTWHWEAYWGLFMSDGEILAAQRPLPEQTHPSP